MHFVAIMKVCYIFFESKLEDIFLCRPITFFFFCFVFQLCILLVSSYLVRNCYTVCACFCAGANTFQVLTHFDPVRARHDFARAVFFPRPRLFIFYPHPFIFRPRPFTFRPRLFRFFRARFVYVHAYRTNVHAQRTYAKLSSEPVVFPSAPNDVPSAHLSIPSAPALMRLRSRVRTRQ
jgi:hypothetical protein